MFCNNTKAGEFMLKAVLTRFVLISTMCVGLVAKVNAQAQAQAQLRKQTPGSRVVVPKPVVLSVKEQFYQTLGVQTFFVRDGALTPEVAAVRNLLLSASEHGLISAAYWTPELENMMTQFNPDQAAQFESLAYQAVINFARDLSVGRVDPAVVGSDVKFERRKLDINAVALALKSTSPDLRSNFNSLAPQWPLYARLKNLHAKLTAANAQEIFPQVTWTARKTPLKIGEQTPAITNIKIRLQTLGYGVSETSPVYTQELSAVVKQYFIDHALPGKADLARNKVFWSHLGELLPARVQQIRMTMEKMRWLPQAPARRYVQVNLAIQRLKLIEDGDLKLQMKTINGRPKRSSPSMVDRIPVIELNPSWTVPSKLVLEDKLPNILQDPGFLERGSFEVVDPRNGRIISEYNINWYALDKTNVNTILLRQKPGLGNALGIMKFHLTNPHAIYLHDTNERHLFKEDMRLLSSGCIRLEKPIDLATELLRDTEPWNDRRTIEDNISDERVIEYSMFTRRQIPLKQPVPVYLIYATVDFSDQGAVIFAVDQYNQDFRLFEAIRRR
jgi:L,D-transpeptidase YcbB